ncbi:nucleoside hydrolase-like [Eupeodes corollae]|uniref:nucleoside hydrolase-like n=1 Tax=Eupeodes corollae TaxID=290404 RepID=UPI0024922695|nr:nucleoside hydrolase-like [Eupeodes corollae]
MSGDNYVVFDCDVGTDDAWALLMLIKAEKELKKFKILGVTCVFGNADATNVTKNTIRVLDSLDRQDIPIYKGCSGSILRPNSVCKEHFHGKDGFGDLKHSYEVNINRIEKTHAVNAMYEFACKYPKKVSFILLGPLTNFATCINMYDDFLDKVKDVWIMGGNIKGKGNATHSAEFNFFSDPEAAQIVLEKAKTPITILPWETCIDGDFGITWDWRINTLGSVKSKTIELLNYVEKSILEPKGFTKWIVCDAILCAAFLYPEKLIVKGRQYHATTELNGKYTRGQMVLDHSRQKQSNVRIIEEIHKENYRKIISWAAGLPGVEIDWNCDM